MTTPMGGHQSIKKSNRCWSNPTHAGDDARLEHRDSTRLGQRETRKPPALNRSRLRPRRRAAAAGRSCSSHRQGRSPSTHTAGDVAAIPEPVITHACNPLIRGRPVVSSTSGRSQEAGSSTGLGTAASRRRRTPLAKSPDDHQMHGHS